LPSAIRKMTVKLDQSLAVAEMAVMDEMACQEFKVQLGRRGNQDLLEHRGHLDPGVGEPLTSGGAEPLVPVELNWFMLAGLQEAATHTMEEEPITCV